MSDQPKRLKKFNGGKGAILCNGCRVILLQGAQITDEAWKSDEPIYCEECSRRGRAAIQTSDTRF